MSEFENMCRYFFSYLWYENGYAVLCTIISTITSYILKTHWATRSKGFHLFAASLLTLFNIPCILNPHSHWIYRLMAAGYALMGACNFYEVAKVKVNKKTTFHMGDLGQFELDHDTMFKWAKEGEAKGDLRQICNLGYYYRNGVGTSINLKKSQHYFQILAGCSDPFWRNEGQKELKITNQMIEEQRAAQKQALKEGAKNIAKDFFSID